MSGYYAKKMSSRLRMFSQKLQKDALLARSVSSGKYYKGSKQYMISKLKLPGRSTLRAIGFAPLEHEHGDQLLSTKATSLLIGAVCSVVQCIEGVERERCSRCFAAVSQKKKNTF